MRDDDQEGWVYLPHAQRQGLQRVRNAFLGSMADALDAMRMATGTLDRFDSCVWGERAINIPGLTDKGEAE